MKKDIKKEYYERTNNAFLHTVVGCVLPFLIASILLIMISKSDKILQFLDKGDFCIYSAALFSTSIYLFNENEQDIRSRFDKWLYSVLNYLLLFAAVIYGAIYLIETLNSASSVISINFWIVRVFSIALFIFSLISVYRSLLIQKKAIFPEVNVESESKKDINQIMKELE